MLHPCKDVPTVHDAAGRVRERALVGRYLLRRLFQFVPVFLGATVLLHALVFAMPGDPIRALAGDRPISASTVEVLRDRYHLDETWLVQYGRYLGVIPDDDGGFTGVLQGDFGTDFRQRPVTETFAQRLPVSARLTVGAFVFELILGLIAGVLAGLRRGGFVDNLVLVSTTAVISIPIFVLGFMAQLLLAVQFGIFPVAGLRQGWFSYVLPSMVVGSVSLAFVARLTRTSLVEHLRADYVRTAAAKGLARRRVIGVHTMRNSLIPVVTFLGVDLGGLMGGAIVTETIFNLPGMGRAVYEASQRQEGPVVVGIVTFLVIVFMVANLLVDLLYGFIDPRIRYE